MVEYEVLALRYATRAARRAELFIGSDVHDADAAIDYFVWVVRGDGRLFVVDTGFEHGTAAKRARTLLRTPAEALELAGVDPLAVREVVATHFHYDHIGGFEAFPNAVFHVQDEEMAFATGRAMRHAHFAGGIEPDHVCGLVRLAFANRLVFHDGDEEIAPGVSVHRIGGHTPGMQAVRVHTRRGWIVLASDASPLYEHLETGRGSPVVFHVGDLVEGYRRLRSLASSPKHIVPGHDPLVMRRYPPVSEPLSGIAARLDAEPLE